MLLSPTCRVSCGVWVAPIAFLAATCLASAVTPIARWDVVPYQRIERGKGMKCGVVAFSKAGIAKVTFRVNGRLREVPAMTLNERTGVWEYWTPIAAADHPAGGTFQVEATVYGRDGGTRVLPPLELVSDARGTIPRREAWVDATKGDDGTGATGDSQRPYGTIGRAMDGIRQWMKAQGHGDRADGGIIRLRPGKHAYSNGRIWGEIPTVKEWVTITGDGTANRDAFVIDRFAGALQTHLLKIEGVTLRSPGKHGYVIRCTQKYKGMNLWTDDCALVGAGRYVQGAHPIHHGGFTLWSTDCYYTELASAVGGNRLARGLRIEKISDDVARNCPLLVNVVANDVDPGMTYAHSDAWQTWLRDLPNNTIAYNVRMTDAHYQGIMCRTGKADAPLARDVAFVNCLLEIRHPIRPPHRGVTDGGEGRSLWMRSVDHLLIWHCSFLGHPLNFYDDKEGRTRIPLNMTNVSVVGCCFGNMKKHTQGGKVDFSGFQSNHIVASEGVHAVKPGRDLSTGDPKLTPAFAPQAQSPLVNRLSRQLVPIDAAGRLRDARPDIGALEHNPEE